MLVRAAIFACKSFPLWSRSFADRPADTEREGDIGTGGGGIATALGIRALGVPGPADSGPLGFGVENGERLGEGIPREIEPGDASLLSGVPWIVLSCFAVIPAYLDARVPGVGVLTAEDTGTAIRLPGVRRRAERAVGVSEVEDPGVILPLLLAGVVRPEGVILPLLRLGLELVDRKPADGVTRPFVSDGVTLPPITDGGRCAGAESFVVAMNTPHFGGQVKYCFPPTEPSFFPFPANPPLSSTPAHSPPLPSISPIKRKVPSNPNDSMRTLSPTSNERVPARLELRSTWLCRLSGRAYDGVLGRTDATDDGRDETLGGDPDTSLAWLLRCLDGSFALIASENARDISSISCLLWLVGR